MARTEIREYDGDFTDAFQLIRRTWTSTYTGKMWFPLWDSAFLNWQVGHNRRWCLAAYDGTRVVGCIFSARHSLQIGSRVFPITLTSWFTVAPEYRRTRVAANIIDELGRRHQESEMALTLGVVSGDQTSKAHRYWSHYERMAPENCRFLFRIGFWAKVLNPQTVRDASLKWWERWQTRLLGRVLRATPWPVLEGMRPYRSSDLTACAGLVQRANDDLEWTIRWSPDDLQSQLEGPVPRTLVYEERGEVRALVNYHHLRLQGREPIQAALIDLCATPGLNALVRSRLLSTLCARLAEERVDLVLCLRSSAFATAALVANAFTPLPASDNVVALFQRTDVPLARPRTWNLLFR